MPRFVILDHDHPVQHWDFLLQDGDGLRAWRLLTAPVPGARIAAELLPDHRLMYLDYEGPVSGNRGRVIRLDVGTFDWEQQLADEVVVRIVGRHMAGRVKLCRADGGWTWELSQ